MTPAWRSLPHPKGDTGLTLGQVADEMIATGCAADEADALRQLRALYVQHAVSGSGVFDQRIEAAEDRYRADWESAAREALLWRERAETLEAAYNAAGEISNRLRAELAAEEAILGPPVQQAAADLVTDWHNRYREGS